MVNGLRGTAHLFAWQVQHLESLAAACGQRSPRDRAPFYVAGAALGAPDAAFAWQVQHLESLDGACGQRSPRDRAPVCVAGAALREPGRCLLHVEFHDVFPWMSETCGET